jgi:glycosyltransferase involved in cell wall biosynthesis
LCSGGSTLRLVSGLAAPLHSRPFTGVKQVHVTHISPLAFGEEGLWGGGERYPLELAREMSRLVSTRLVVFGPSSRRYRVGRLQVCQLATRGLYKEGPVNPLSELLPVYAALGKTLHLHQYHSVVTNVGLLIARLTRRPVFCTDYGGASYDYADRLSLGKLLTGFLPISSFSASFFPELADRIAEPLLGGVDIKRFQPDGAERVRQVVFVGRLLPHKGIDVLIRALDDRTPCRIFGRPYDPAYRAQLERLAAGKDVSFHENASDREIAEAYRRSRVAVLPSVYRSVDGGFHPWSELLGLTMLEAMACGTPVVASRVGGLPEIVQDEHTGYLVDPGDPGQLGDRIAQLLEPSARWQAMSERAVELVRDRFTWRHVAERCLAAYERMSAG